MFTVARRREVQATLLARARDDHQIVGAAVTGSGAVEAWDRWSDVDLFFGVADGVTVDDAVRDWSAFLYRELGAVHHFDLRSGVSVYRAFLLDDLLEIDLGFTPGARFGPLGEGGFHLVFGDAAPRGSGTPPNPDHVVGLAWHHVLHARSSIERGSAWQAEYWISALRDHVLTLACLRLDLPSAYAKGADRLPSGIRGSVGDALVRSLDVAELDRALRAATGALLDELGAAGAEVVARLGPPLRDAVNLPSRPSSSVPDLA